MKLVLASQSASRRAMLEAAGVPFSAQPAYVDEAAAKQFGLKTYTQAQRAEMLDKAIGRLAGMQAPNGGFTVTIELPYVTDGRTAGDATQAETRASLTA